MNISFSCNIADSGGHNFVRLSVHIGDTILGEGWETLGLTTAALQDVLANLNALQANPSTTPPRDIRPAQAEAYVFTEHNALPCGSSAFDGDRLLLFKSEHHKNPHKHRYTALRQAYGQQALVIPRFSVCRLPTPDTPPNPPPDRHPAAAGRQFIVIQNKKYTALARLAVRMYCLWLAALYLFYFDSL